MLRKSHKLTRIIRRYIYALPLTLLSSHTMAAGSVQDIEGQCNIAAETEVKRIIKNGVIDTGSLIFCGAHSRTDILMDDGTAIRLHSNSSINFRDFVNDSGAESSRSSISLIKGFVSLSNPLNNGFYIFYKLVTPVGSIDYYGYRLDTRFCAGDCNDVYPLPADGLHLKTDSEDTVLRNYSGNHGLPANMGVYVGDANSSPATENDNAIF